MNAVYEKYIHSAAWRKIADMRLELDYHTCQVCGKPAGEVHHLTYENLGHEKSEDIVSLCRRCHRKAEDIYNPKVTPWSMATSEHFMAAICVDAQTLAPMVYEYIKEVRGADFDSLMKLRQPDDRSDKYWSVLKRAVNILCAKRYSQNCAADRTALMLGSITHHVQVICLAEIEHYIRNSVQKELHDIVMTEYAIHEKWKAVANELGISTAVVSKLRSDDGSSMGPTLRECVLYYSMLDAAAGIHPQQFSCLTHEDCKLLSDIADYQKEVFHA